MDFLTIGGSIIGSLFGNKSRRAATPEQPYTPVQRYNVTGGMTGMPAGVAPVYNPSPAATQFGYKPAGTEQTPHAPAVLPPAGQPIHGDPNAFLLQQAESRRLRQMMAARQFNLNTDMAYQNPFFGIGLAIGRGMFGPKRSNGNIPEQNLW